jgi:autoinducer 2-degrading protein
MADQFVVVVDFRIKRDFIREFEHVMLKQAADSLALEPGCHYFDVVVDAGEPDLYHLYEVYTDAAAFAAHREYPHYHDFVAASTPLIESKVVRTFRRLGSPSAV